MLSSTALARSRRSRHDEACWDGLPAILLFQPCHLQSNLSFSARLEMQPDAGQVRDVVIRGQMRTSHVLQAASPQSFRRAAMRLQVSIGFTCRSSFSIAALE